MSAMTPFNRTSSQAKKQTGLTLIELLVAMTIGLLIVLAAAAALLVSRQGFFAVDAASQLRDNARYAQDIIQRLGVQAGFKNVFFLIGTGSKLEPPHGLITQNARAIAKHGMKVIRGAAVMSGKTATFLYSGLRQAPPHLSLLLQTEA